jgi:hypothetical protein
MLEGFAGGRRNPAGASTTAALVAPAQPHPPPAAGVVEVMDPLAQQSRTLHAPACEDDYRSHLYEARTLCHRTGWVALAERQVTCSACLRRLERRRSRSTGRSPHPRSRWRGGLAAIFAAAGLRARAAVRAVDPE